MVVTSGDSSSGKFIAASSDDLVLSTSSNRELILIEKSPRKDRSAALADIVFVALIMSATASTWVRSILLLTNALSVNSPGLACDAKSLQITDNILSKIIGLP